MTAQKIIRQILILLALAAIPAAVAGIFHPKRPAWQAEALAPGEVLLGTAQDWGDRVIWLDARSGTDFHKAHIPGALLLNEDDWDGLLPQFLNVWRKDRIIVVYCNSLECHASHEVAKRLREEAKLPQVYVLKGGWDTWLNSKK